MGRRNGTDLSFGDIMRNPVVNCLLGRLIKKLRRLLQRKRQIKIELCARLSVLLLLHVGHVVQNRQSTLFACLARTIFMQKQRMKNILLRARDVDRTSKIKISRRRLTEYVENFHQKACRTCSTIIFPRSTNQSIDLWLCRCRCRRHFLNSLLFL